MLGRGAAIRGGFRVIARAHPPGLAGPVPDSSARCGARAERREADSKDRPGRLDGGLLTDALSAAGAIHFREPWEVTVLGRFSACILIPVAATALFAADEKVSFNRDIRPIMAETCFRCHGPDKSSRMAGMRLDLRDEAMKPTRSRRDADRPGRSRTRAPSSSASSRRARAKLMPPAFAHKELTPGAEKHHPPVGRRGRRSLRRPLGLSAGATSSRPQSAARRFEIRSTRSSRSGSRREGLKPSPEADRRTLHPPRLRST